MSTHSRIAIKNGTFFTTVYCHFDGYPKHVGKILLKHYSEKTKLKELLVNGSLSSLGSQIYPNSDKYHSFRTSQDDVCVFYHRERDEDLNIEDYHSEEELLDTLNYDVDYIYYFDPKTNKWFVADHETNEFNELTPKDCGIE